MKHLSLLILLVLASSCTIFKKDLQKSKTKEHLVTDSTSKSVEQSTATAANSYTRNTTESIDTLLTIPGSVITATGSIKELMDGKTIKVETPEQLLNIKLDPQTGALTVEAIAKQKKVPVNKKKHTTETGNSSFHQDKIKETLSAGHTELNSSTKEEHLEKTREPATNYFGVGVAVTMVVMALLVFLFLYLKRRKLLSNEG